ncbi:hypothetical protein Ctob_004770 [Chrysochromulina tobinii]|uniref:Uncharacterized protein n=1 Tax=Chrysochromulina tobinii TaxID=1460289 RepID=A0A0M0JBQ0_9EUKA|nr:hypothetical protein Ctob_004770 [Chrysochromulina tobinii]|eukprot:KOO23920.1 hypothetical protein Ctob_004770 [Chrysochromulina sp. CCMP291]
MQARNQEMATSVGGGGSSVSLATRTVDVHAHVRDEDSPERVLAANETLRERQQIGVTDYGPPSPRKRRLSKEPPSSTDVHAHARGEDSPEKDLAANETLREQQQSGVTDFGPPSPRKKMSSRAPMSSPRVQRLEVREQKKASVKCASTLDFTALSACDKGMFRDCQDGCEAERAHGGHGQDGCEAEREQGEGVAMADRTAISTAISTRICSQLKRVRSFDGDSDGDSDVDHDLQDLNLLSNFGGSQSGRISSFANRLETPPGAPNALEAHKLLVACPAPRRPAVYAVDRKCTARLRVPPHLDTFSTEAF